MDKISQLSDDLLIKILSLVPTNQVVSMSMLSKRWRFLWTLVPILIFGDYSEEDEEPNWNQYHCRDLSQCVYGALLLHKAPVLDLFHLNGVSECSASQIDLWVGVAVDRFVRDLKIQFCFEYGLIRLPSRLFRCETLETLELRKVVNLEVPSRFTLRSLKTMRLLFVKYADEESFVRLISNCPVLEDLVVETCHDDNVATFTVDVPSLESFSIRHTLQDFGTDDDVFVIHYHSLKKFTIVDYFSGLNLIGNKPKLVEANLLSLSCHAKVLQSFPCIKRLSLCLDGEAQYPTGVVLFQLVCLEFCLCESNWTDILVSVLQHCPKLQVLNLALNHLVSENRKVCWIEPSCVPECFVFHLKTFEWRDYDGSDEEKEVAIYILNNARQLVTATIYPDSLELASSHQMLEELEIATMSSRTCELRMGKE